MDELRDNLVPAAFGDVDGVQADVTGPAAETVDFNDNMKSHLPYVFGFVLTAAFLLLLVTFRSIVIPIKAILLNLLSVGAAYGVLVLVFQNEWAEGLLNFTSSDAIVPWLPLFLFVVLFGLSMDYHVFLLTRVREAFDRGMNTEEAVSSAVKKTAGVITSAAVVMVAVFAIFATLTLLDFKQMGVGLAVAVLLDATIIRGVLLPASMKLLGDWNWYLPKWLEWLPAGEPGAGRRRAAAGAGAGARTPARARGPVGARDGTPFESYGSWLHDRRAARLGAAPPPAPDGRRRRVYPVVADETTAWLVVHVGTLVFVPLMAAAIYVLLRGVEGTAARVSRIALGFFVVFYLAFEVLIGIGTGVFVDEGGGSERGRGLRGQPVDRSPRDDRHGRASRSADRSWDRAPARGGRAARGADPAGAGRDPDFVARHAVRPGRPGAVHRGRGPGAASTPDSGPGSRGADRGLIVHQARPADPDALEVVRGPAEDTALPVREARDYLVVAPAVQA